MDEPYHCGSRLDRLSTERILLVVGGLDLGDQLVCSAQNTELGNDETTIAHLAMRSVRGDKPM